MGKDSTIRSAVTASEIPITITNISAMNPFINLGLWISISLLILDVFITLIIIDCILILDLE